MGKKLDQKKRLLCGIFAKQCRLSVTVKKRNIFNSVEKSANKNISFNFYQYVLRKSFGACNIKCMLPRVTLNSNVKISSEPANGNDVKGMVREE